MKFLPLLFTLLPTLSSLTQRNNRCPSLPPNLPCTCTSSQISCSGLNSTDHLSELEGVEEVTVTSGNLACLTTSHLPSSLTKLTVRHSGLTSILCPGSSFNSLPHLTLLDLSNNSISNLERDSITSLPASLTFLELRDNSLPCAPSLTWLNTWVRSRSTNLEQQLNLVQCMVENSPMGQSAPLLRVMDQYASVVNPSCPPACSCHFYHFAERPGEEVSYTVRVDCSGRNLTSFPTLPSDSTVLDLSHNLLNQAAYEDLDVVRMNYINLRSLILSHNRFSSIDMKLFKLKLDRAFKADHNVLTELPYDFSQLLQNFDTKNVTLGYNQWMCSCHAEITSVGLQRKIQDQEEVTCAEGSLPESIVGRRLTEVDHALLCPPPPTAQQQELVLKAVCVVLASLIIIILTKLLYDYWQYRHRGKLPWIVYKMP